MGSPNYSMILLTRLNGEEFMFNAIYIEQLQSNPDTTITTIQGKKFVVKEAESVVVERIKRFYKEIGLLSAIGQAGEQN